MLSLKSLIVQTALVVVVFHHPHIVQSLVVMHSGQRSDGISLFRTSEKLTPRADVVELHIPQASVEFDDPFTEGVSCTRTIDFRDDRIVIAVI